MTIYIGSDHRGFGLKQQLKQWLLKKGHAVKDIGAYALDPADDYPVISEKLGQTVISADHGLGILLCGSGVGASAAVNKIDGIRGAIGISPSQVQAGRHDDDMNVLILAADDVSIERAEQMVEVFLTTPYHKTARYQRRINQIKKLEA